MPTANQELIVVSNRLPCVIEADARAPAGCRVQPGSGGLVTAMAPVLRRRSGVWIGWSGAVEEDGIDVQAALDSSRGQFEYSLQPVALTREQMEGFYEGFANQVLWPLFHSLDERCSFLPRFWHTYGQVNEAFAAAVERWVADDEQFVWVHDYHLMLVAQALRRRGVKCRIGFFLHTPFPSPNMFLKLPWRQQILQALLEFDLIGFQTIGDRRNFVQCLRTLLRGHKIAGHGRVQLVTSGHGEVGLGTFPISIDYGEFADGAADPAVTARLEQVHREYGDRKMILGVDRLDYTKGIPGRLRAFQELLERHPGLHCKVNLVQIVVPSRSTIRVYKTLKEEIEELVGQINGRYTEAGWVPVHYWYRSLSRTELLAFYRRADVCLVTPLNDGMNLVAKEYCACNIEESGVLVLSEFAGAAAELRRGAILVNPYDFEGVGQAMFSALTLPVQERRVRMQRMRRYIRQHDVFAWVDSFLRAGRHHPAEGPQKGGRSAVGPGMDYDSELAVHGMVSEPGKPRMPSTRPATTSGV